MKKLLSLLLAVCCGFFANAQSLSSYQFDAFSCPYSTLSGSFISYSGGGYPFGSANYDDCYYNSIPIGFNFNYCGTTYTSVSASANCWLVLGQTFPFTTSLFANTYDNDLANTAIAANLPRPILAALWTDCITPGANVRYSTTGTSPNQVFTIEWTSVAFYPSSTTPRMDVQIKLYETSNIIDFHYNQIASGSYSLGLCAIGITGGAGAYAVTGTQPCWSLNNATSAPTASMSTITRNISGQPGTDQVYRWSYQCAGTPNAGSARADTVVGCTSYRSNLSLNCSETGYGITYQWQSSSDSSTWTSVTGATNATYTATVTATTYFRCVITCGASGISVQTAGVRLVVNPSPGTMSGPSAVCVGATITLSNSTAGGSWSSSATGVATVGSGSGVVTGVSPGTAAISYTLPTGCYSVATVTVNITPAPISGPGTVCTGTTGVFTSSTGGGTWSCIPTTVATIGSSTGVVSGVAPGTAAITYSLGGSCLAFTTVTVIPSPSAILGTRIMCRGLTTTLSSMTTGGTWSSGSVTIATVDTFTGVVTGVFAGTAIISYVAGGCPAMATVTVQPLPNPITGLSTVCVGATTPLTNSSSGGTWSSSSTAIATVGATTGLVGGVSAGTATITYTLPTGCLITTTISVNPIPAPITGTPTVCVGLTTSLTTTSTGGIWSSSNVTRASVGATTGEVRGVAAGTSIISYTFSSGCTATMVVTVNPLPSPITGVTSLCVGATSPLTNTTAGGTWSSSNSNATIGSSTGIVTGVSPGSSVITYTLPTGCIATTIVNVNNAPAPISGITTICAGSRTTLSTTTAGGTWGSSTTSVATVISSSGIVTGVSSGSTTITYRVFTTGCIATVTVTVTPLPRPISGVPTVCVGATTTLTDTVTGGSWTISGSAATIDATTGVVTGTSIGTGLVTYSLGASCTVTRVVTVSAAPGAITGPLGLCVGATGTLSCLPGGGAWSSSASSVASIHATTGIVTALSVGTTVITYSVGTGCISTATLAVSSGPSAITGPTVVCPGSSITLTSTTGGGTWSTGSATATVGLSTGIIGGVSPGAAIITYSLGAGCAITTTISVSPLPTAFSVTGGGAYCVGGSGVAIGLSGSAVGVSYRLYLAGSPVGSPVTGTGGVLSFGLFTTAGTYTATATTASTGCTATMTGSAIITINPLPSPIIGATALCAGTTTTLTNTGGGTWASSSTGIATVGVTSGVVTGMSLGTAIITYTLPTGCFTTTTLSVSPAPGPITGAAGLCVGATATLSNSVTGGLWSTGCSTLSLGTSSGIITGLSIGSCTVTYSLGSGCTVTGTVAVTPAPSAISGATVICVGRTTTLSNSVTGGVWSSTNSAVATISTSGVVSGLGIGTSIISYSLGAGCTASTTVVVSAAPSSVSAPSLCSGTSIGATGIATGGTWSSSATAIATIDLSTGMLFGVSAGTVTITYSLGSGCSLTATTTVLPAPAAISGPLAICLGATTTLSSATAGGTWSSGSTAVATITAGGVASGASIGTTTISYTLGGACAATATLVVNPSPGPILGLPIVCAGQSITLSNTVTGGTWSSTNLAVATVDAATGALHGVSGGTSRITYSLGGSCFSSVTATVHPLSPIVGSTSVCVGRVTTLSTLVTGGVWTSSSTGVATVGTVSGIVSSITTGTEIITYTLPSGCRDTAVITVNSLPSAISGPLGICLGAQVTLSSATGGGTWSSSRTFVATIGGSGEVGGVSAGTSTITYSLGSGCTALAVVTVYPLPIIASTGTAVCVGLTSTLSGSSAGGTWTMSTSAVASVTASGVLHGIMPGTEVVTYTLLTGCSRVATITVNSLPAPISGTLVLCEAATTTLTNADAGGVWGSSNLSIATIGATTGILHGVTAGTATISYLRGGCPSTATVTVSPLPGAITGPGTFCTGSIGTLSVATGGGTWSSGDPATATIDAGSGAFTAVSSGTVIISYTVGTGCRSLRSIVVNPIAPITGPSIVCVGDYIYLYDTVLGGTWSSGSTGVATASTLAGSIGRIGGVAGGASIVTYTTGTGCMATHSVSVLPAPAPILGAPSVCLGFTTTLSTTATGGVWSSSDPLIASVDATGVVTGTGTGIATITYFSGGCPAIHTMTVHAIPGPLSGSTDICDGSTVTLSDPSGSGGIWSSSTAGIASVGLSTGVVLGRAPGTATITYMAPTGCSATIDVTIHPLPAPITGIANGCVGGTIFLTNTTSGGYWASSASGIASVDATTGTVSGLSAGVATISYIISGTGCLVTLPVTIHSLPPAITGPASVCVGATVTWSNAATGGTWSSAITAIASVNAVTGVVDGIATGLTDITYTLGTGCSTQSPITVNPLPAAITGNFNICVSLTSTLSSATTGGTWASSTTGVAIADPATGVVTGVLPGSSTITYTLGTGCVASASVLVGPLPSAIFGSTNICSGAATTLTNTVSGGLWTSGDPTVATIHPGTGVLTSLMPGTAVITYTLGGGCYALRAVQVYPLPVSFTVTGGGNYCAGGTGRNIYLSGSQIGVNYLLYLGATPVGTYPGTGSAISFGPHTVGGTYHVLATSTSSGCSRTMAGTASIVVDPTVVPAVTIAATPAGDVCEGTAVTYAAVPTGGGSAPTYYWEVNGVHVGSTTSYSFIPAHGDAVRVRLTSNAACAAPDTATRVLLAAVVPYSMPDATVVASPGDTICKGNAVVLTASGTYTGSTPWYGWIKNGLQVATGNTYTYIPAEGDVVYARLASSYPCRTADTVASGSRIFTIDTPIVPQVTITGNPGYLTWVGHPDTLHADVVNGGSTPTYQWIINGAPVPGATTQTFISTTFVDRDSVSCLVTGSLGRCPATSHGWMYILVSPLQTTAPLASAGIGVHPNPNNGTFTITGTNNGPMNISITDMLGRTLQTQTIAAQRSGMNTQVVLDKKIPSGSYLLTITSDAGTQVHKIEVIR